MTHDEALASLAGILIAAGITVSDAPSEADPPVVTLFSDGGDMREARRDGATPWRFRVVCIAGSWDQRGATVMLATTVGATASAIWAAPGWVLDRVSGDRAVNMAGGVRLAADVYAITTVTL